MRLNQSVAGKLRSYTLNVGDIRRCELKGKKLYCPECGGKTKTIKKRIKKDASIGSPSSIAEFMAVILFISAFIYPEAIEYMGLVILISVVLALLGHDLRYRKIRLEYCKACKKEFPVNWHE